MISFLTKFRIPTFLGLAIIFLGIIFGVILVLREQTFISRASPNLTAQNITITNIEDTSAVISWETQNPSASFVSFSSTTSNWQTALDDRDTSSPKKHQMHYVTLKNLQPLTSYQFKIISGKVSSELLKFETAKPTSQDTGFSPITGVVLDNNQPIDEAIVYLSIAGVTLQSALVKNLGNFLIPISSIRREDLSNIFQLTEDGIAKITAISNKGGANTVFKLKSAGTQLPPIKIGQNLDLTSIAEPVASPTPQDLKKYDLNGDGQINANDHAIVLQNFSQSPQNKKADLNGDGVVDQKDVDLISKKFRELGLPIPPSPTIRP